MAATEERTQQAKANRMSAEGYVRTIFSVLFHGAGQHGCFIYALVFNMSLSDENVQITDPNSDVWVFVKMSPCPGITGFPME